MPENRSNPTFKNHRRSPIPAPTFHAILFVFLALVSTGNAQFGSTELYFSQVVINDGSFTTFSVHNPSGMEAITVAVQLYSSTGSPVDDGELELPPGGTDTITFGDPEEPLTAAWAELSSDGEFTATEFFQIFLDELKPRVGVLPSAVADELRLFGFVNSEFKSGLALANPDETASTEVTVLLRDNAGQRVGNERRLMLGPRRQSSAFLNEDAFFGPDLMDFEGVVEVTASPLPVVLLTLIQDQASGDIATISAVTQSQSGPAGLSDPQQVSKEDEFDLSALSTLGTGVLCSAGTTVLSGGFASGTGFAGDRYLECIRVMTNRPNPDGSGWSVTFYNACSSNVNTRFSVWAICASSE